MFKIAVLISGNGSNLESLIKACKKNIIKGEINLVISNNPDAFGIERAKKHSINYKIINNKDFKTREDFDLAILKDLKKTSCTLHLHPPHIVAAMHAGWELCDLVAPFPEVFRYTRVGKNVEDFPALSKDLALQTAEHLVEENKIKFDIVGQESHGVCSIGSNPWNAFEHIERVEHICKIVLLSGVKPPSSEKKKIFSFIN